MISVPILLEHDPYKVIGYVTILEEFIPTNTNFDFTYGGRIEYNDCGEEVGFELLEVSLISKRDK